MESTTGPSTSRSSTDVEKNETGPDQPNAPLNSSPLTQLEPEVAYPGKLPLFLVFTAVISSIFVVGLDQTIVATAIPRITEEFKGLDKVSWYGSAYFLTSAGATPAWGKLFRYIPIKTAFLAGLFVFELGSLICGVAPTADALIVGRAIAGLGCGGLLTGSLMMITYSLPPATRAMGFSTTITGYGISAALGPVIGGAFTGNLSWRWCFYINLPIGVLTCAAILFTPKLAAAKTTPASIKEILLQLDLVGVSLLTGAIVAMILALQFGGTTMPWASATVVGLLVGFGLILAVFAVWQAHLGELALFVPRLLRLHRVWASSVWQFCFSGTYFIALYYLPIYFQSISGASPAESGVRNLPLVLAVCLVAIPAGKVLGRWPSSIVWFKTLFGSLAMVTCGLFYSMDLETTTGEWIGFQIVGGVAWSAGWQCALLAAQGGMNHADLPIATSTVNLSQFLGGAIGVSIAQALFNNRLLSALAQHAPGLDAQIVLHTGATELRTAFSEQDVPGVIAAYLDGLRWVWILTIAMMGFAMVLSLLDYVVKRDDGRAAGVAGEKAGEAPATVHVMA
ncbi:MFS transporter DHA2 family glioxin efflux transporter [Microdochium nivale]|nr:MFS transporter DHA2 family glioxin efflux transporter [Microdochium nivale]